MSDLDESFFFFTGNH